MTEKVDVEPITVAELMRRCDKMSFLLGLATAGLFHIVGNDDRPVYMKEPLVNLLNRLMDGVDELFYKGQKKDE